MVADTALYGAYPGLFDVMPVPLREQAAEIQLASHEAGIVAVTKIFGNWPFDRSRIKPAIAPTVPLHCSDSFLLGCRYLARDYGLLLQTHLAEAKTQAVLGLRRYGRALVAHLDQLQMLGPHLSVAHAIWLDDDRHRAPDALDHAWRGDAGPHAWRNPA